MILNGIPDSQWEDTYKMCKFLEVEGPPTASKPSRNDKAEAKALARRMVSGVYGFPLGSLLLWIILNPSLWSLAFKIAYWWLFRR